MGLISRYAEANGIPTLCMSSVLDVTKSVNPPRAAFLDFPLGHTAGKSKDPPLQREILIDALDGFSSLTEPGSVKMLPFEFSEDTSWKIAVETSGDERLPRFETPQFQTDEDRNRAEAGDRSSITSCGCSFCFENWKNRGDLK